MEIINLKNRITLGHMESKSEVVHMSMIMGFGSIDESGSECGATHLYEHLVLKKFRNAVYSLEAKGAIVNAFADWESLSFQITVNRKYWRSAASLFMNILMDDLSYPEEIVEKEKNAILEENETVDKEDEIVAGLFLNDLQLESRGSIQNLSVQSLELINFLRTNCSKSICVYGNIKTDDLIETFDGILFPKISVLGLYRTYLIPSKPILKVDELESGRGSVFIGLSAPGRNNPNKYLFELLITLLAGTNSATRLFAELRLKRNLIYDYESTYHLFEKTGVFIFQYEVSTENLSKSVQVINSEFNRIGKGISMQRFDALKECLINQIIFSHEISIELVSGIAEDLSTGNYLSKEDQIEKINSVSYEELNSYADQYFSNLKLKL